MATTDYSTGAAARSAITACRWRERKGAVPLPAQVFRLYALVAAGSHHQRRAVGPVKSIRRSRTRFRGRPKTVRLHPGTAFILLRNPQIGRASCRERV